MMEGSGRRHKAGHREVYSFLGKNVVFQILFSKYFTGYTQRDITSNLGVEDSGLSKHIHFFLLGYNIL